MEPTDAQVALLCDIGERDLAKLSQAERGDLEALRAEGFIEAAGGGAGYKLTAKGMEFLGERGAGLNAGESLQVNDIVCRISASR